MTSIRLYTDASVKGDFLAKGARRQRGPALGAWVGWFGDDLEARPCVAGMTFLGENHGPNSAEYHALIAGLEAVLLHLKTTNVVVDYIGAYTDSEWVVKQMNGRVQVDRLRRWHDEACEVIRKLEEAGVWLVDVAWPPKKDRGQKQAHSLTTQRGWNALFESQWRPEQRWPGDSPPAPRRRVTDDDIPF